MLWILIGSHTVFLMAIHHTSVYSTSFGTSFHRPLQQWQRVESNDKSNTTKSDEFIDDASVLRNVILFPNRFRADTKKYYKLRYHPVEPMPRLLWHKFQLEQQNATSTQSPDSTTIATVPTVETTTKDMDEVEEATTTTSSTLPSTSSMKPTLIRPSPSVVFTTPNTIMRPANKFIPTFFNALKNIELFGSPFKANILQKRGASTKGRGKGFLGLFEVVQINNTKCSVEMGDVRTMDGICYHDFECKNLGGIPTKPCAEDGGICCIFLTSCGNSTDQSIVYFESPNYPNPVQEMMICVLIVNLRPNTEQIRLDFLMFELNRPSNGDCLDDQFIVSGLNMNYAVPILCGINTGQHMYLHVGNSFENKIYLSFFAKVPKGGRSFNIKVVQLEDNLAPTNCLQYFTDQENVVKSFNYDIEGAIVDNKEATYLNNLNYAICLERAKDTCSVIYLPEHGNGELPSFQIINKDEDENDFVPDGQAGAGIYNCPDDYIAINSVRLCGERFNDGTDTDDFTLDAPVRDVTAGPIVLPVHTDSEYVGRGFYLHYKQELCG